MPKGTRPTDPKYQKLAYTQEQLDKLEQIREPRFKLRVARKEFVNHVLHPDGSISSDTSGLAQAAKEAAIAARDKATDVLAMMAAAVKFAEAEQVQQHLDMNQFLVVADENGAPVIWFQCAIPNHPEEHTFNGEVG